MISISATRPATLRLPSRRASPTVCNAASFSSPGTGSILYSGAGKSGTVLFGADDAADGTGPAPASPAPASRSSTTAPGASPSSGSLSYVGAGKTGVVSFAAPKAATIWDRLAAAGLAGVVSYGLFNTLYYAGAFLLVWFNVAKFQSGQGIVAAAQAVAKVLAVVWAGSQATKVIRAGAALAIAPFTDKLLEIIKIKLNLASKRDVSVDSDRNLIRCLSLLFSYYP